MVLELKMAESVLPELKESYPCDYPADCEVKRTSESKYMLIHTHWAAVN